MAAGLGEMVLGGLASSSSGRGRPRAAGRARGHAPISSVLRTARAGARGALGWRHGLCIRRAPALGQVLILLRRRHAVGLIGVSRSVVELARRARQRATARLPAREDVEAQGSPIPSWAGRSLTRSRCHALGQPRPGGGGGRPLAAAGSMPLARGGTGALPCGRDPG